VLTLPDSDHMVPLRAAGAVAELAVMAVNVAETPA
jgi:hypothetical protein